MGDPLPLRQRWSVRGADALCLPDGVAFGDAARYKDSRPDCPIPLWLFSLVYLSRGPIRQSRDVDKGRICTRESSLCAAQVRAPVSYAAPVVGRRRQQVREHDNSNSRLNLNAESSAGLPG